MQLVGYMDSPFVRRVAVSAKFLDIQLEHRALSIFSEFDEFRQLNPLIKVPTLICNDGQQLVDSTLIIEYMEKLAGRSLVPANMADYTKAQHLVGVSLVVMEKVVQTIYENRQRPEAYHYAPWNERITQQLHSALGMLEDAVGDTHPWFFGEQIMQADISTVVAWTFVRHILGEDVADADYPALAAFAGKAETVDEFRSCPLS